MNWTRKSILSPPDTRDHSPLFIYSSTKSPRVTTARVRVIDVTDFVRLRGVLTAIAFYGVPRHRRLREPLARLWAVRFRRNARSGRKTIIKSIRATRYSERFGKSIPGILLFSVIREYRGGNGRRSVLRNNRFSRPSDKPLCGPLFNLETIGLSREKTSPPPYFLKGVFVRNGRRKNNYE